ncbi:MAG: glutamate--tRNA ligase family protein [bacterium]|nr:glutamate--tRNA ligase family protein [bacterium]
MSAARVRFAPSPTGFLHVGSARTALFNWIYARSVGGRMLLRIEDTDEARNQPEAVDLIYDLLTWLGIDWDEAPLLQSQRRERHREAVESLLECGAAYLCDADNQPVAGTTLRAGLAARFRMPAGRKVSFHDAVRGEVSFASDDLEDFVVWRSGGAATFLLANAVDDVDMGVSHAIRGEDLLSGAPKVILLLEALGAPPPVYAHLPLLVNAARKKLSKRRDDVSLGDYRARGYLPEAMANHLALLGWGPTDGVEIRPMAEIIQQFRLADVNRAPAFFDTKKLEHFNGVYIRALSTEEYLRRSEPWLGEAAPWPAERTRPEVLEALAPVVQEKVRTLGDIGRYVDWLFLEEPPADDDSWRKAMGGPQAPAVLDDAIATYAAADWTPEAAHAAALALAERHDLKLGKAQAPIRVALTGRTVGPPLFESMVLLDRAEVLRRLRNARARLDSEPAG